MTAQKPLMLKDFLELDAISDAWDVGASCSAAAGRPGLPTVRHLLDSELRSKTALTKISHIIHSILSKRLRWRKRRSHVPEETADVDDRPSTSTSDDHETRSTVADVSDLRQASPPPPDAGVRRSDKEEQRDQEMECCRQEEEEEEQLSPVFVMDFPDDDDDGGDQLAEEDEEGEEATISPRFQQTLHSIERTRLRLLEKIRRFESLAELDLDLCSSSTSKEEEEEEEEEEGEDAGGGECAAWDMLCQLKARVSNGGVQEWWSIEKVLLSFFAEGLSSLSCYDVMRMACYREKTAAGMMAAAAEWIGGGRGVEDVVAAGMEERRWMWLGWEEEEEEVAEGVEIDVLGWLVEELVLDLVSLC